MMNRTREITQTAMVGALLELRIVFPFEVDEDSCGLAIAATDISHPHGVALHSR